jgi:hypothetical protein
MALRNFIARPQYAAASAYGTTPGVGEALAPRAGTWPGSYMFRQDRPVFSLRSKQ